MPDIPTFHDGGTFRAQTPGGEGLALLQDGERVSRSGGGTPEIIQLVVDGRVLAQVLRNFETGLA